MVLSAPPTDLKTPMPPLRQFSPPKLAFGVNYLRSDIVPDFSPPAPRIDELRKLATASP